MVFSIEHMVGFSDNQTNCKGERYMEELLVKDEQEVDDYSEVTLEENQAPSPPFHGFGRY